MIGGFGLYSEKSDIFVPTEPSYHQKRHKTRTPTTLKSAINMSPRASTLLLAVELGVTAAVAVLLAEATVVDPAGDEITEVVIPEAVLVELVGEAVIPGSLTVTPTLPQSFWVNLVTSVFTCQLGARKGLKSYS